MPPLTRSPRQATALVVGIAAIAAAPSSATAGTVGFATLDRMDDSSRWGVQLGLHSLDLNIDAVALRSEVYGQWLVPGRGVGLYAQLPVAILMQRKANDAAALQNLEIGGFWPVRSGRRLLVFRGGASLPTAPGGRGFAVNAGTLFERPSDMIAVAPDAGWLRGSGSVVFSPDGYAARLDLGLASPVVGAARSVDGRLFGYVNGGVANVYDTHAFTLELANAGSLDGGGGWTARFIHTLALGIRTVGRTQFHFAFVVPLDQPERGDLWIITLGLGR